MLSSKVLDKLEEPGIIPIIEDCFTSNFQRMIPWLSQNPIFWEYLLDKYNLHILIEHCNSRGFAKKLLGLKSNNYLYKQFGLAARYNLPEVSYFLNLLGKHREATYGAVLGGHRELYFQLREGTEHDHGPFGRIRGASNQVVLQIIFNAGRHGDLEFCRYILNREARGKTAIEHIIAGAAMEGHVDICEYYINDSKGRDKDRFLDAALEGAVMGGRMDLVKQFINREAIINYQIFDKAVEYGHMDLYEYFIASYSEWSINNSSDRSLFTDHTLYDAGTSGNIKLCQDIIKHYDNCVLANTVNDLYRCQIGALNAGHLDLVKWYIGEYDWDGNNALVVRYGHLHIIKYLVELGDFDFNYCMLEVARADTMRWDILEYLISLDNQIDYYNAWGGQRWNFKKVCHYYHTLGSDIFLKAISSCSTLVERYNDIIS